MLSNYPPGVTGSEPAIAGYPEGREQRECGADVDAVAVPVAFLADLANATDRDLPWYQAAAARLAEATPEPGSCAFDGPVDVAYATGAILWTCPWCGVEHDDPDDGDDDHHDDH